MHRNSRKEAAGGKESAREEVAVGILFAAIRRREGRSPDYLLSPEVLEQRLKRVEAGVISIRFFSDEEGWPHGL